MESDRACLTDLEGRLAAVRRLVAFSPTSEEKLAELEWWTSCAVPRCARRLLRAVGYSPEVTVRAGAEVELMIETDVVPVSNAVRAMVPKTGGALRPLGWWGEDYVLARGGEPCDTLVLVDSTTWSVRELGSLCAWFDGVLTRLGGSTEPARGGP